MSDDPAHVAEAAAVAAAAGAAARVIFAARDGERRPLVLALEVGVGSALGCAFAALAVYFSPEITLSNWSLLIIGGGAGAAGAIGRDVLDIVAAVLRKRGGG